MQIVQLKKKNINLIVRIATPPKNKQNAMPGLCSSYIFNLRRGDQVSFSGPYGDFLIKATNNEMMYIGGGAGMAPIKSHLFHLFYALKTRRKVTFFYGARSLKESFFENKFRSIERRFVNFRYFLALSEPLREDKWVGMTGFISDIAYKKYLKKHKSPEKIEYYLCGPPPMVSAAQKMLNKIKVKEKMISFDKF